MLTSPWLTTLVVVAPLLYLARLGAARLWDYDEAFYAQIAREMASRRDWIIPRFQGQPRYDKPPLLYWIYAALFRLRWRVSGRAWPSAHQPVHHRWPSRTGSASPREEYLIGPLEVRLPSAAFCLATILLTVWETVQLGGSWIAGAMAGWILATSPLLLILGRMGMMDAALTFFVNFSTVAAAHHGFGWAGLGLGLAILSKGPLAVGLVGLGVLGRGVMDEPRLWMVGLPVALAVALPWYVACYRRAGRRFLAEHFGSHQIDLLSRPMQQHGGPALYYVPIILVALHPWWGGLLAALAMDGGLWARALASFRWQPLLWVLPAFLFFSLIRTKAPAYILPLLPPLASLVAVPLSIGRSDPAFVNRLLGGVSILNVLMGGLTLAGLRYAQQRREIPALYQPALPVLQRLGWLWLGIGGLGGLIAASLYGSRLAADQPVALAAGWTSLVSWAGVWVEVLLPAGAWVLAGLPGLNRIKPQWEIALRSIRWQQRLPVAVWVNRGADCSAIAYSPAGGGGGVGSPWLWLPNEASQLPATGVIWITRLQLPEVAAATHTSSQEWQEVDRLPEQPQIVAVCRRSLPIPSLG